MWVQWSKDFYRTHSRIGSRQPHRIDNKKSWLSDLKISKSNEHQPLWIRVTNVLNYLNASKICLGFSLLSEEDTTVIMVPHQVRVLNSTKADTSPPEKRVFAHNCLLTVCADRKSLQCCQKEKVHKRRNKRKIQKNHTKKRREKEKKRRERNKETRQEREMRLQE